MIPSTDRPCWSHMAVESSDVGSNSSLVLFWFDLSTPGYCLSNRCGVVEEIMFWWTKVFCDRKPLEPLGETRPCGKARCKTCKMINPTQIAKSASGARIKLRCNTSCKTINVGYLITCTKCGKQYVGETGDHVNQRMNGHRDDWKHKRFERSPVAEHFCNAFHFSILSGSSATKKIFC